MESKLNQLYIKIAEVKQLKRELSDEDKIQKQRDYQKAYRLRTKDDPEATLTGTGTGRVTGSL